MLIDYHTVLKCLFVRQNEKLVSFQNQSFELSWE